MTLASFWLPTRAYNVIDAINRMAAATGSPRYAAAASHADYNGHFVTVSFKPHAASGPTWNAEYMWAGRVVLGRGSFERCLEAALQEHARGALGSTVLVNCETDEQVEACLAAGLAPYSKAVADAHHASFAWWTEVLHDARSRDQHGHGPGVAFLANSSSVTEYRAKCAAWDTEQRARRTASSAS